MYDIQASHHGVAVWPFHNEKNPSMKMGKHFHCFVCQTDGIPLILFPVSDLRF